MTLADRVRFVRRKLHEKNISNSSRLHQSLRAIESNTFTRAYVNTSEDYALEAKSALADAIQLDMIFTNEDKIRGLNHDHIKRLASGKLVPGTTGTDQTGHNMQFELFIAATCAQAGMSVQLAEPDVLVTHKGVVFSIAVKRLTSAAKLGERLREATKQIERAAPHNGFVFIDISEALNPQSVAVATQQSATIGNRLYKRLERDLETNLEFLVALEKLRETPGKTLGVCVVDSTLCYMNQSSPLLTLWKYSPLVRKIHRDIRRYKLFSGFRDALNSKLPEAQTLDVAECRITPDVPGDILHELRATRGHPDKRKK